MKIDKLLFGTAGIPFSTLLRSTVNGIGQIKQLGLGCMEMEFVHSINITKEKAPEVKAAAEKHGVVLTCHAPYFINLNSLEPAKAHASIGRIVNSAKILSLCGGWSVCYHPGFFMKSSASEAMERCKKNVKIIMDKLADEGVDVWVRPETTGKHSAVGNLAECIELSKSFEKVLPCIDFAHLHARANGGVNSYAEFCSILETVEKELGKTALNNMHIHYSGINYGEKGEKNHLILKESDAKWQDLLKALKKFKVKGCLICESPNLEKDALIMSKFY